MKFTLFYLALTILVACSVSSKFETEKKPSITQYKVSLHGAESFPLFVESVAENIKLYAPSVAPKSAPINMESNDSDPKVRYGREDEKGNLWQFGPKDDTTVHGISFAPYYSFYSYNVIQTLRQSGAPQLNPNCDVDTKFLIIFFMSKKQYPLAGCVK